MYNSCTGETFGDRLKIERIRKGLSQSDLSKVTGITRTTISEYELNNIIPSKDTLLKIGHILNLDFICCEGYSKLLICNFYLKLKYWREKNNYSIYQACKIFNIDKSSYYRWEKGVFIISRSKYYSNKALVDSIMNL